MPRSFLAHVARVILLVAAGAAAAAQGLPEFFGYTHANWSPAGDAILTESHRGGGGLYLTSLADGSVERFGVRGGHPRYSPDGEWIALERIERGNGDVYRVRADGTGLTRLTDDPAMDLLPFWSPDGSRLGFNSTRDGNLEVYVMNADGSDVRRLTNHGAEDMAMSWSPDGSSVLFHSRRGDNVDLYTVAIDSGEVRRLTDHPAIDRFAVWSPDGTRIAFASMRDGDSEIYLIDADGSNPVRLTEHPANDTYVMWSPDGERLCFQSDRHSGTDVYTVNRDGEDLRRITRGTHFLDYVERHGLEAARAVYARHRAESGGFVFYRAVMSRRGRALLGARRYRDAAAVLTLTTDRYPRSIEDHLLLAKARIELREAERARESVLRALALDATDPRAKRLLAFLDR